MTMIGVWPQIYKSFMTKSTSDVSMLMLINYFICSAAWLAYGGLTSAIYVIISNIFGVVTVGVAIWQKLHYDKK